MALDMLQALNFYCSYFSCYITQSLLQIFKALIEIRHGIFGGVLLEARGIALGFDVCPHLIIPITWNPEYLQPWGEGELIHKRRLFEYYKYTCMAYEVGIFLGEAGYWSMSLF